MKCFSFVAAIVLAALCTSNMVAQDCGCNGNAGYATSGNYATSAQYGQTYSQPMMTSYASQGCSGCYNTSIAPAVSCGSGCESSNNCCNNRGRIFNRNRNCNTCSTGCNTTGCGNTSGCSGCNQTYASMPASNGNCGGCSSTYASAPVSTGNCGCSGTYTSNSGYGCGSSCGSQVSNGCCGSSTYATNWQARRGCRNNCGGCGSNNGGSYSNCGGCGSNYGSYNNCGGAVMSSGGQMMSGCGDCISGSVPVEGSMNQDMGTPVPSPNSDVEPATGSEKAADMPPSPEDT